MERLTESNGSTYMAKDVLDYATPEILDRLGRYEDIGCTPEQLKQIDKWYADMCRELGEYKRLEEQGLVRKLPDEFDITY